MSRYEDGLRLIEERCRGKNGEEKDNLISLTTIATEPSPDGNPRPYSRDVDAYYEDGAFYIVTHAKSKKMLQIAQNPEVSFTLCAEWFSGNGTGINLGWVLDPKNAQIRTGIRAAFINWYDSVNNENDENCCYLKIQLTKGIVIKDHHAETYYMDFVNKTEGKENAII